MCSADLQDCNNRRTCNLAPTGILKVSPAALASIELEDGADCASAAANAMPIRMRAAEDAHMAVAGRMGEPLGVGN